MQSLVPSVATMLLIVLRTFVIYLVVLLGVRLTGKREVGQFTPFDLVLILLIANAVQNAMVGPDNTLIGGVTAAVLLFGLNWAVGLLAGRNRRVRKWLIGSPTVLVSDGNVVEDNMHREDVTPEELEAALHEHGLEKADEVRLAVLEIDGTISVVPCDSKVLRTQRRVRQVKHAI